MKSQDIIPVVASIAVIVLVALLEKQSKLIAAITAVMPITAPLALWIVYTSTGGERMAMAQFTLSLALGLIPTLAFLIAVHLAARAGLKLIPMLLVGYTVWGAGVGTLIALRGMLGLK